MSLVEEKKKLLAYIPKEFKPYVADIYEGEKEWNETTKRWNTELVVEWENGGVSYFASKTYARECLKETYLIDDVRNNKLVKAGKEDRDDR